LGFLPGGIGLPSIYVLLGSPKAFTAFLKASARGSWPVGVGALGLTAFQGSVYSVSPELMSQGSRKLSEKIYEYAYEIGLYAMECNA
jgi:hypothetical protein